MSALDLDSFNATPLKNDPYDFLIVPGFIAADAIDSIDQDYPRIAKGGSFPFCLLYTSPSPRDRG